MMPIIEHSSMEMQRLEQKIWDAVEIAQADHFMEFEDFKEMCIEAWEELLSDRLKAFQKQRQKENL